MAWWDFFRIFQIAFKDDPLAQADNKNLPGAGSTDPNALDVKGATDGFGGTVSLRETGEMVDFTTVTNRFHRYKEYDRLSSMAEIDMAMTVFADEACLHGDTLIATPTYGFKTIQWLAENLKDERFLVYCYDFEKRDFTLGWAFNPRKTKEAETIEILFDDGHRQICTPDHLLLMDDKSWKQAGDLRYGDRLTAFYCINARQDLTGLKTNQFPRIYTYGKGWIHQRQFVDEWTTGREDPDLEQINSYCRYIAAGVTVREMKKLTGADIEMVRNRLRKAGFSNAEMKWLGKKPQYRRVVGVFPHKNAAVYDLSVEKHKNFATNWGIVHNCQKDDDGRVMKVVVKNQEIKEELEYLLFHRKMLNFDPKKLWGVAKRLFTMGDYFWEIVIDLDNPKDGIANLVSLPCDSMYRIETTKGRLVEFQQSKEGPDYQSLARVDVTQATEADLAQSTAIRFSPEQIVHIRIGDDRKTFYPYGISLIEPARGPAHQLRLMEDAMVVYRLTRAPERRVFYIDTQNLPPPKAEAFVERMKAQLKKHKVAQRSNAPGASSLEERWHLPPADEDFWIPIRQNVNTRVETLPGAENLGEIDDTVYFRNKLFTALNFPRNYFNNEDPQSTRITLSSQDSKFARLIERLQSYIQDTMWEICDRHLRLRGYPEEAYEDLQIIMTPPSDWRELTRAEVMNNRIGWITSLMGAGQGGAMSLFDCLTKIMKYPEDEVQKMIARLQLQKLQDLKLQIIAQNPALLGVGIPGPDEQEMGAEPGGPNPMLGPEGQPPPEGGPPPSDGPLGSPEGGGAPVTNGPPPEAGGGAALPEPEKDDIKKYNLDIKDFAKEMDEPEIDYSEQ